MTTITNLISSSPDVLLDFTDSEITDPRVEFKRASPATCYDAAGNLITVPANTPRIDYDPSTGQCRGLLMEKYATNLFNGQTKNWHVTEGIQPNTIDGVLMETASTGVHSAYPHAMETVAGYYIFSITVKMIGNRNIGIGAGGIPVIFDGFTGRILVAKQLAGDWGVITALPAQILPDGWIRISCEVQILRDIATSFRVNIISGSSTNVNYTGDPSCGIMFKHVQYERGRIPTSYIPTVNGPVTRAADVAWYRLPETIQNGTLIGMGVSYLPEYEVRRICMLDALNAGVMTSNPTWDGYASVSYGMVTGGFPGFQFRCTTDYTSGEPFTSAISFSSGVGVNGPTDALRIVDKQFNIRTLFIGCAGVSGEQLNGHVKRVAIYSTMATPSQLQTLAQH